MVSILVGFQSDLHYGQKAWTSTETYNVTDLRVGAMRIDWNVSSFASSHRAL